MNSLSNSFIALWWSDRNGKPCNGGAGDSAVPGLMQKIGGPLQICTKYGLHATTDPAKHKGERLWVVALHGEVQRRDDKAAALVREIIGEIPL